MITVYNKRCRHVPCTNHPAFKVAGRKMAECCKQHAAGGMGNVLAIYRRCLRDSCTKIPSFNVESSKAAAYCQQHAEDGIVNVCMGDAPMTHVPCEQHSMSKAIKRQYTANSMPRKIWWTFAAGVARMPPARSDRSPMWRGASWRRTAGNMQKTEW